MRIFGYDLSVSSLLGRFPTGRTNNANQANGPEGEGSIFGRFNCRKAKPSTVARVVFAVLTVGLSEIFLCLFRYNASMGSGAAAHAAHHVEGAEEESAIQAQRSRSSIDDDDEEEEVVVAEEGRRNSGVGGGREGKSKQPTGPGVTTANDREPSPIEDEDGGGGVQHRVVEVVFHAAEDDDVESAGGVVTALDVNTDDEGDGSSSRLREFWFEGDGNDFWWDLSADLHADFSGRIYTDEEDDTNSLDGIFLVGDRNLFEDEDPVGGVERGIITEEEEEEGFVDAEEGTQHGPRDQEPIILAQTRL